MESLWIIVAITAFVVAALSIGLHYWCYEPNKELGQIAPWCFWLASIVFSYSLIGGGVYYATLSSDAAKLLGGLAAIGVLAIMSKFIAKIPPNGAWALEDISAPKDPTTGAKLYKIVFGNLKLWLPTMKATKKTHFKTRTFECPIVIETVGAEPVLEAVLTLVYRAHTDLTIIQKWFLSEEDEAGRDTVAQTQLTALASSSAGEFVRLQRWTSDHTLSHQTDLATNMYENCAETARQYGIDLRSLAFKSMNFGQTYREAQDNRAAANHLVEVVGTFSLISRDEMALMIKDPKVDPETKRLVMESWERMSTHAALVTGQGDINKTIFEIPGLAQLDEATRGRVLEMITHQGRPIPGNTKAGKTK